MLAAHNKIPCRLRGAFPNCLGRTCPNNRKGPGTRSARPTWLAERHLGRSPQGVVIMKKTLILAAGCGLFASVAFAQTPPAGSAPAAQDFVNKVAISDMFEILRCGY
jgi:hypothetical protein